MNLNQINFLPSNYTQKQKRRLHTMRRVLLLMMLSAGLAGWHFHSRYQTSGLQRFTEITEAKAKATKQQAVEADLFRQQLVAHNSVLQVDRQLSNPVSCTQVLATLGQLMPEGVALTDLSMKGRQPSPTVKAERGGGRSSAAANADADVLHLTLTGLASDDAPINDFVNKLSQHPLFVRVNPVSSKPVEVADLKAREFEITLEVPLNREYKPSTGGLAHVR